MKRKKESNSSSFIDSIKRYIDLKTEYYQLAFVEKASVLIGKIVLLIFTAFLSLILLSLIILLVYNLLMAWIGVPWIVSLIEIGFVCLLVAIMWIFRKPLVINPVAGSIIKSLLDSDAKDNEEDNKDEE